MMKTLTETGNGWITFKDICNSRANQTGKPGRTVHSSNLCTEIVEITSDGETAYPSTRRRLAGYPRKSRKRSIFMLCPSLAIWRLRLANTATSTIPG